MENEEGGGWCDRSTEAVSSGTAPDGLRRAVYRSSVPNKVVIHRFDERDRSCGSCCGSNPVRSTRLSVAARSSPPRAGAAGLRSRVVHPPCLARPVHGMMLLWRARQSASLLSRGLRRRSPSTRNCVGSVRGELRGLSPFCCDDARNVRVGHSEAEQPRPGMTCVTEFGGGCSHPIDRCTALPVRDTGDSNIV
jgi:hypothetical protein